NRRRNRGDRDEGPGGRVDLHEAIVLPGRRPCRHHRGRTRARRALLGRRRERAAVATAHHRFYAILQGQFAFLEGDFFVVLFVGDVGERAEVANPFVEVLVLRNQLSKRIVGPEQRGFHV